MICENCQNNNATVNFTQVINGQTSEFHVCEACAEKLNMAIGFNSMFKAFFNNYNDAFNIKKPKEINCPTCGYSFNNLRNTGKLGCSDCYKFFENQLENVLKNIQANNKHVGKVPSRMRKTQSISDELNILKEKLQAAIKNEEYEEAAKHRDRIRELEKEDA